MICTGGNSITSGAFISLSGTNPSFYTQYNYSYVALTTSPILMFAFETDLNSNYFLDSVSVTKATVPSIQLLQNSGFENSTTQLNGWVLSCNATCSAGAGGQATYGTNCYLSTGNCFLADCPDTSGTGAVVFLGQAFSTTIGITYTISFRLKMAYGGSGSSNTRFTASIR
ncbi:unnamed protein product [Adineta steineri]|uniref:Uncharacterized protein n=1 Tax=Adineta steineri TaxID=433720 RepID=A0A816FT90_9BILA|nr:unnamed protein product [Adineta steineri]CAF1665541.1 unnamed protein product [Adineta steineri]